MTVRVAARMKPERVLAVVQTWQQQTGASRTGRFKKK
jgi:hypothetical protein